MSKTEKYLKNRLEILKKEENENRRLSDNTIGKDMRIESTLKAIRELEGVLTFINLEQKIKAWDIVRLDERGIEKKSRLMYLDDNGSKANGNYDKNNIAGNWLVIEGKVEIDNGLTYIYRTIDNTTLIKV
ncbi:MAG: hypothetical protein ACOCP4_05170 [Candidatus Woesearchaeota archaeon]